MRWLIATIAALATTSGPSASLAETVALPPRFHGWPIVARVDIEGAGPGTSREMLVYSRADTPLGSRRARWAIHRLRTDRTPAAETWATSEDCPQANAAIARLASLPPHTVRPGHGGRYIVVDRYAEGGPRARSAAHLGDGSPADAFVQAATRTLDSCWRRQIPPPPP